VSKGDNPAHTAGATAAADVAGFSTLTPVGNPAESPNLSLLNAQRVAAGKSALVVPATMVAPVATAGSLSCSVAFTPLVITDQAAITNYTVTSSPGGFTKSGLTSPLVVTGLTALTAYTFTIVATNIVGNSTASPASNSATATA